MACIDTLQHLSSRHRKRSDGWSGHNQGHRLGVTYPRYLRTRQIDVDETLVVHGLGFGAGRGQ